MMSEGRVPVRQSLNEGETPMSQMHVNTQESHEVGVKGDIRQGGFKLESLHRRLSLIN